MIDVEGRTCTTVIAREFWLDGKQQTECCALFVELDGEKWVTCHLDDSYLQWVIRFVDAPEQIAPFDGFSYPHADVSKRFGLLGRIVHSIESHDNNDSVTLSMHFRDGHQFHVTYSFSEETERMSNA